MNAATLRRTQMLKRVCDKPNKADWLDRRTLQDDRYTVTQD